MINIKTLRIELDDTVLVDIAFTIERSLAMVGESGSGKSLSLKSLLGMAPSIMNIKLDADFDFTRGEAVVLVPQNPFTSLSPLSKIKKNFFCSEALMTSYLQKVGLDAWALDRFPSELSGGQLQRVVVAIALSHEPKLLLLDEPTTALDSESKHVIISLLKKLQNELDFYMLFVSHDMASVEDLCEEIVVLHKGKVIEAGKMKSVLSNAQEPYTQALIAANFKTRSFRS
jgi:peptide/nickel transport system ATP-binding protein